MYKVYLLAFDPYKTNATELHNIIKNNLYVSNWWHYLGSAYLLQSSYTLETIRADIIKKWPNQNFLLIEVKLNNSDGWLPKDAWDWIKKYE